jgi:hypothetical protein
MPPKSLKLKDAERADARANVKGALAEADAVAASIMKAKGANIGTSRR